MKGITMRISHIVCGIAGLALALMTVAVNAGEVSQARFLLQNEARVDQWVEKVGNITQEWMEGFAGGAEGKVLQYNCHLSSLAPARLVRATDGKMSMAWNTQSVPDDFKGDTATFVWVAGIGCNLGENHFDVQINGKPRFLISSSYQKSWSVKGEHGGEIQFDTIMTDKHDDNFGYMRLTAPAEWLNPGKPVQVKIVGRKESSPAWFMVFEYTNTADWIRGHCRNVVLSSWRGGIRSGEPVTFSFAARRKLAGKSIELRLGNKVLAKVALKLDKDIAACTVDVEPSLF